MSARGVYICVRLWRATKNVFQVTVFSYFYKLIAKRYLISGKYLLSK